MLKFFLLILGCAVSISHAENPKSEGSVSRVTSAASQGSEQLYKTVSENLAVDAQLRSMSGMMAFNAGSPVADAFFPGIKAEWEKSLNSKFSSQEIKYINDTLSSQLFKRYFQFHAEFINPTHLTQIIAEQYKASISKTKAVPAAVKK